MHPLLIILGISFVSASLIASITYAKKMKDEPKLNKLIGLILVLPTSFAVICSLLLLGTLMIFGR